MKESFHSIVDEFLTICLAYCITWELAGARAPEYWTILRAHMNRSGGVLNERLRWTVELYEEGPPSAQEERSLLSRIEAQMARPKDTLRFRENILAFLPETIREKAAGHSLLQRLMIPTDSRNLKHWLMRRRASKLHAPQASVPLSEREADYDSFLELPYFLVGFRRFWRTPPKYRTNRQTRVLLCFAAALSQSVPADQATEFRIWLARLARECHLTPQSELDLAVLVEEMAGFSYDTQELAYHLSIDTEWIDNKNLRSFIGRYKEELTDFATDLLREVTLCSV